MIRITRGAAALSDAWRDLQTARGARTRRGVRGYLAYRRPFAARHAREGRPVRLLLAALLLAISVSAMTVEPEYDALFRKHGEANGVDWRLLKAIAIVESHLNPRAENPDGISAGIMQIHCVTSSTGSCRNRFDLPVWPPVSRAQLYDPDYNIAIGAQILAWNIEHLGLSRGIAAYNQWSARHTQRGKPFPNQYYVDKVLRTYRLALQDRIIAP